MLLTLLPFFVLMDPAPGLTRSKTESRNLDCERITAEAASRRYPGQIEAPKPRGEYMERAAVVCRERLLRPGVRPARDEAILSSLQATTVALAENAASVRPDLQGSTWLVEAYYPSGPVAGKISFAAKNVLMGRGLAVSDRTPVLNAADIDVITRMSPDEAYPAACRRYYQSGTLGEGDALLAVISRDRRETALHAGLCTLGEWTWLR